MFNVVLQERSYLLTAEPCFFRLLGLLRSKSVLAVLLWADRVGWLRTDQSGFRSGLPASWLGLADHYSRLASVHRDGTKAEVLWVQWRHSDRYWPREGSRIAASRRRAPSPDPAPQSWLQRDQRCVGQVFASHEALLWRNSGLCAVQLLPGGAALRQPPHRNLVPETTSLRAQPGTGDM